jgi:thiol-disulfide isomerase/thioredoxin
MKFFLSAFLLFPCFLNAQTGYKTGDVSADLKIAKLLNHPLTSSSLNKIHGTITIIDFFGTWCAPCIKALPELAKYKNIFKEDISILLVSTEAESKLAKFISSRQPFTFPMVVDEDNLFTNNFNPSSYPYTVVLDKNLKVLSITNAADLSEVILKKFIDEGKQIMETKPTNPAAINEPVTNTIAKAYKVSNNALVKLSQDFMYAAKTNEDVNTYTNQLKDLKYAALLTGLKTDDDKKAFWINLYNAFTNASLHKDPDQYKNRNQFFKAKNIIVAGKIFSLDKIEHGILRRSKIKWSLGYFSKLFPQKTEKDLRVDKLDYRIHFALNCGAKSCPPIAFYNPENINTQLDVASAAYLAAETKYDAETNILKLPAILSWFRRDFGGKQKMIELLQSKQLLKTGVTPQIKFKKYDWALYLDNYKL